MKKCKATTHQDDWTSSLNGEKGRSTIQFLQESTA